MFFELLSSDGVCVPLLYMVDEHYSSCVKEIEIFIILGRIGGE